MVSSYRYAAAVVVAAAADLNNTTLSDVTS